MGAGINATAAIKASVNPIATALSPSETELEIRRGLLVDSTRF